MATRTKTNTVYAAGLRQRIALVTFPTASTILTHPPATRASAFVQPASGGAYRQPGDGAGPGANEGQP